MTLNDTRRCFGGLLGLAFAALLAACGGSDGATVAQQFELPKDFYPESMTVDSTGTFYISSFRQGAIAILRPGETTAQVFVPSGSNGLVSAEGLLVDESTSTLWNCSGDFGYSVAPSKPSALKSFDLKTGAAKGSVDLPGGGFCNDMAMDSKGTIYVTDSLAARVLRLKNGATAFEVWAQGGDLAAGASGLTVNGIALDGDQTMYVSKVDPEGYIVRIAIAADGSAGATQKVTASRVLNKVDGMRVLSPGKLVLFENDIPGPNDAVSVATITGATVAVATIATGMSEPTSGVAYGGRIYYLESKFASLLALQPTQLNTLPTGIGFTVRSVPAP